MLAQDDPESSRHQQEFGFGDHILVSPVSRPAMDGKWMHLPPGGWYNFWDDTFYAEKGDVYIETPLEKMPIFVKAGAVVPFYPVAQFVGESSAEKITLHIYYIEGDQTSYIYEDAGDGYDYKNGTYLLRHFKVSGSSFTMEIKQQTEGNFKSMIKYYQVVIHGFLPLAKVCLIDGNQVSFVQNDLYVQVTVAENFKSLIIR